MVKVFFDEANIMVSIEGMQSRVDMVKQINMRDFFEKWVYHLMKTSPMHQKFCTLSW